MSAHPSRFGPANATVRALNRWTSLRAFGLCLSLLIATVTAFALTPSAIASSGTTVSSGEFHSCVLTSAGAVKCWGSNTSGELGDGTTTSSSTPVDVTGLGSPVAEVIATGGGSCALTTAGGVKCWGANWAGQLGDGTTIDSSTPVDVSGLGSGVVAIAGGEGHNCALTDGGSVKCWGRNDFGQLGNGTTTNSAAPVDVSGLSGVTSISAGIAHTCAVTATGDAKCWGSNFYGELGNGTTSHSSTPVDVSGLDGSVAAISAGGEHTCVLTAAGGAECWGYNGTGDLGDGTTTNSATPVDVSGLGNNVAAVSAGGFHSCALTTSGAVNG